MQSASALNRPSPPARPDSRINDLTLRSLADEAIARLTERGSKRAFAALYERYHGRLHAYCYLLLNDADNAYDALQSTLARALAELRRGEREAPLGPWLFRIADEEATALLNARAGDTDLEQASAASEGFRSADEAAEERARLALLLADLRDLPDVQRSALVMRELSGLSHEEIAAALDISAHGARQAIFHARRSLTEFRQGRSLACEEVQHSISRDDGRTFRRRGVRAHLRDCALCTAFAASIPQRRADLQALAPPLAPMLAGSLAAQLSQLGSGHGAGGLSVGATKTFATSLAIKALAATAIVASASAGVGTVSVIRHHAPRQAAGSAAPAPARGALQATGPAGGAGSSPGRPQDAPSARSTGSGARSVPPPAQENAATGSAGEDGTRAAAHMASTRGDAAADQGLAGAIAAGSADVGGSAIAIQQHREPIRAHGNPATPHAHGSGGASGPPSSAHAATEPGSAAHVHAANDPGSSNAGAPSVEANEAASTAPSRAGSAPHSDEAAVTPDETPPSAGASGSSDTSQEAPAAAAPETGASSSAT